MGKTALLIDCPTCQYAKVIGEGETKGRERPASTNRPSCKNSVGHREVNPLVIGRKDFCSCRKKASPIAETHNSMTLNEANSVVGLTSGVRFHGLSSTGYSGTAVVATPCHFKPFLNATVESYI